MAIAIGDLGVANTSTVAMAPLDRGWTLYAHTPPSGSALNDCADDGAATSVWESLGTLHDRQISHGDLRSEEITIDDGTARFGGFGSAEYGATDEQLQADVAQLLVTTTELYGAEAAVGAAIDVFGKDAVLTASRRLTKSAMPSRIRKSVADRRRRYVGRSRRGEAANRGRPDQVRDDHQVHPQPGRSRLVLLVALVYVAYPFISTVPAFFSELKTGELVVGAARARGVGADVYRCGSGIVGLRRRAGELQESRHHAGGQHVRRDHHARRCRRTGAVARASCRRAVWARCARLRPWRCNRRCRSSPTWRC